MLGRFFWRRWTSYVGVLGILSAALSGCGGSGGAIGLPNPNPNPGGGNPTPSPGDPDFTTRAACTANTPRGNVPRWTVLVYINAANNLQPDSLTNIAQMASIGSDANVNIVVQWKQANCADCGIPSYDATRRYLIRQHSAADVTQIRAGNTAVLDSDRLSDAANTVNNTVDMGDWRVLKDFVSWGTQNYPADHLMVIVWNHGSGWRPTTRAARPPVTRAVSQDNQTGNEIQTAELPQALAGTAQPIDVLAFDASLMQMAEVAYEVRNSARVMIGSEESPPGAGYPYDVWLTALKNSGANPCDLSNSVLNAFVAAYPSNANITQSLIDLSKMDNVATQLNSFGAALRGRVSTDATAIENARDNVQRYDYPENKDLYHYADLIRTTTTDTNLQTAAVNLQNALRSTNGAIMRNRRGQFQQTNSNGLAIYIPRPGAYLQSYNELALTNVTVWDEFLREQVR